MVNLNGRNYFVDQELREFRSAGSRATAADFVRFDSAQGRAVWDQYLIATCSKCGTERVEPRHASGVKCHRCGAWVLL
jgi:ribosomal protein S27E